MKRCLASFLKFCIPLANSQMTKYNPHLKIKNLSCMASNFLPVIILIWCWGIFPGLTKWGKPFSRVGSCNSSDVKQHQEKAAYTVACPCFLLLYLSVAAATGILSQHQTPWPSDRNCPRISQVFSTGLGWLRNPALWIELPLQGSVPAQCIDGHCSMTWPVSCKPI